MRRATYGLAAVAVFVALGVLLWPRGGSRGAQNSGSRSAGDGTFTLSSEGSGIPDIPRIEREPFRRNSTAVAEWASFDPVTGAPAPKLIGQVVMKDSGDPVAGAKVHLVPGAQLADLQSVAVTDSSGLFEFSGLQVGAMRQLFATADHLFSTHGPREIRVMILPGERLLGPYTIEMSAAPTVHLKVIAKKTREPIRDATVQLIGPPRMIEKTDAEGAVKATLAAGSWTIVAGAPGYVSAMKSVNLSAGSDAFVEFELDGAGVIYGHVLDSLLTPVKGASIMPNATAATGQPNVPMSVYAQTDENGYYRIDTLPLASIWRVAATVPNSDQKEPATKEVMLTHDAPEAEVNFVINATPRPELEQPVFAVQGVVRDEEEQPIAGALVVFGDGRTMQNTIRQPASQNFTDSEGRFAIETEAQFFKERNVGVFAEHYEPQIVRAAGGPTDKPQYLTITMKPGRWVKGRVVDGGGDPVTGALVTPFIKNFSSFDWAKYTDGEGRFEFDSLTEGAKLQVTADGYGFKSVEPELDRDDVVIVLESKGMIIGRVIDEKTREPVPAFKLTLRASASVRPGETRGRPPSNHYAGGESFYSELGQFAFRDLTAEGVFDIAVEARDYPPASFTRIVAGTQGKADPVELALSKESITLAGRAVDSRSTPLAGAEIQLYVWSEKTERRNEIPMDTVLSGQGFYWGNYYTAKIRTDENGEFQFERLPKNKPIDLAAKTGEHGPVIFSNVERLSEAERTGLVLKLPRAGRIFGSVDREIHSAANQLYLRQRDGSIFNWADLLRSSEFDFPQVTPGKYRLILYEPGENFGNHRAMRVTYEQEIDLAEGEELEIRIGGDDLRQLSGVVTINGEPAADSPVRIRRWTDTIDSEFMLKTDDSGRFEIDRLLPGNYDLTLVNTPGGSAEDSLPFNFSPYVEGFDIGDDDLVREFRFSRVGHVTGRIANSPPDREVSLFLTNDQMGGGGNWVRRNAKLEADGSFVFRWVPADTYALRAQIGDATHVLRAGITKASDGENLALGDIALETGGTIHVRFAGEPPAPSPQISPSIYVRTRPVGNDSMHWSHVQVRIGEPEAIFEDHPPGRFEVVAMLLTHRGVPPVSVVDVAAGQTTELVVSFEPVTFATLTHTRHDAEIVSVSALSLRDGRSIEIPRAESDDMWRNPAGTMAYYVTAKTAGVWNSLVRVRDFPPGRWRFTMRLADGSEPAVESDLIAGNEVNGRFEFAARERRVAQN